MQTKRVENINLSSFYSIHLTHISIAPAYNVFNISVDGKTDGSPWFYRSLVLNAKLTNQRVTKADLVLYFFDYLRVQIGNNF